jgi:hypothetical protein
MASTSYEEVSMDLLLAGMLIGILLSATFNRRLEIYDVSSSASLSPIGQIRLAPLLEHPFRIRSFAWRKRIYEIAFALFTRFHLGPFGVETTLFRL